MDVRVDEAGADDLARDIDLGLAGIFTHADDLAAGDGNISMAKLIGENIHIGGVFQNEIRLFPSGGDVHKVLLFHQLALDPCGVGFIWYCHRNIILSDFPYHAGRAEMVLY